MKTLKIILASTFLLSSSAMAMTAKASEDNKKIYEVLEGDSSKIIGKPGLAVELKYKTQHVDVGVLSDVNMSIRTVLKTGMLKVKMKTLEDDLSGLKKEEFEFEITEEKQVFPLNLQLSSATEGRHYLTVYLSVEGEGGRVFDIPVYIGDSTKKISTKAIDRTEKGDPIIISVAEEEIK